MNNIDFLTIAIASAAFVFSIFNFWKTRKNQSFVGTRDFNLSWQAFNQLVSNDTDFQDFETALHPYDELSRLEVKRMYFYFLRFNTAYSAFRNGDEFHSPLALSALRTEANVSFKDREFVRKNVFGRGYDKSFSDEFEKMWDEIKSSGQFLAMHGDVKGLYLSPVNSNTRHIDCINTKLPIQNNKNDSCR